MGSEVADHSKDGIAFNGDTYSLSLIDTAGQVRSSPPPILPSPSPPLPLSPSHSLHRLQNEYSLFPRSCSVDVDGFVLVYAINSKAS